MGFGPCNCSLKICESTGTPIPKVRAPLGVWGFIPSHVPTLPRTWDVTIGLVSWPAPLQALALVTSPRLGLQQKCHFLFPTSAIQKVIKNLKIIIKYWKLLKTFNFLKWIFKFLLALFHSCLLFPKKIGQIMHFANMIV
jgi:hypothetical protein